MDELTRLFERQVELHMRKGWARPQAERLASIDVYGGDLRDENDRPIPDNRLQEAKRITGDA